MIHSRSAVKNISQTPYHKPLKEWKYDETLMKKREPFQRMKEVAEQFLQLLEAPQKDWFFTRRFTRRLTSLPGNKPDTDLKCTPEVRQKTFGVYYVKE